jgi:hypothetical protein
MSDCLVLRLTPASNGISLAHSIAAVCSRSTLLMMYPILQTLLTYGPSDFSGNDLSKKGLQGRNMVYKLLLSELLSDRETIAPAAAATTTAANGATAGGLGGRWMDR